MSAPARIDVRQIRAGLRLSQPQFAMQFGLNLGTLRKWEQGRCYPDEAARALLAVVMLAPDTVRKAVGALA